jgi:hypothetical protein
MGRQVAVEHLCKARIARGWLTTHVPLLSLRFSPAALNRDSAPFCLKAADRHERFQDQPASHGGLAKE